MLLSSRSKVNNYMSKVHMPGNCLLNMVIGPDKELGNHTISQSWNALEANRK